MRKLPKAVLEYIENSMNDDIEDADYDNDKKRMRQISRIQWQWEKWLVELNKLA